MANEIDDEVFMPVENYLKDTESAIKLFFEGLDSYFSMKLPSLEAYIDESGFVQMSRSEAGEFLKPYEKYFALEFSRATLAGSILQVAYMALKKFSSNSEVSQKCQEFGVVANSDLSRYCVGREVHGIPIGLLIYVGRIQYNHWEDGHLKKVPTGVFDHLANVYHDDQDFDMVYALHYPEPHPVSHYIVRFELGWITFDDYIKDMRMMLVSKE